MEQRKALLDIFLIEEVLSMFLSILNHFLNLKKYQNYGQAHFTNCKLQSCYDLYL